MRGHPRVPPRESGWKGTPCCAQSVSHVHLHSMPRHQAACICRWHHLCCSSMASHYRVLHVSRRPCRRQGTLLRCTHVWRVQVNTVSMHSKASAAART